MRKDKHPSPSEVSALRKSSGFQKAMCKSDYQKLEKREERWEFICFCQDQGCLVDGVGAACQAMSVSVSKNVHLVVDVY